MIVQITNLFILTVELIKVNKLLIVIIKLKQFFKMGKVGYRRVQNSLTHITIKKNIQQKQQLIAKIIKRIIIKMDFIKTMMFTVIKLI